MEKLKNTIMDKIIYKKLKPIDHVLARSEMYVGSIKKLESVEYVFEDERIFKKNIKYSDAFLRILLEPFYNAIDNIERNHLTKNPMTYIKIEINDKFISFENDGYSIPIEKNNEGIYNQTLVFGNMLSGSNFGETQGVSGANGLGIKLTNIFSSNFKLTCVNDNKIFTQEWNGNMKIDSEPLITKTKSKNMMRVEFVPDNKIFGDDLVQEYNLFYKYVIDVAMMVNVKVYLNTDIISLTKKKYISFYEESEIFHKINHNTSIDSHEVYIIPATVDNHVVSFVNNLYTKNGGNHQKTFVDLILENLAGKISKNLLPKDIRKYFSFFIFSKVENAKFSTQQKEKLVSPEIIVKIGDVDTKPILKWDIIKTIKENILVKEKLLLKPPTKARVRVEGLDHANKLGKDSYLILTEGLSAKTYAVAGIVYGTLGKKGRNHFGILPLTGKLLNVRNASMTAIANNKVIQNIIAACKFNISLDYSKKENFNKLNYSKIIIIADSDKDGIHITSLITNFLYFLYPSLFQNKDNDFLYNMKTPVAKIDTTFYYDEYSFLEVLKTTKGKVKYYKGLGTINSSDVEKTFGKEIYPVSFEHEENILDLYFSNKCVDFRKQQIINYENKPVIQESVIDIKDYCNNELIKFSIDDCNRSLPNIIDGLKVSQRKILYSMQIKNVSLKVSQLGGYVSEKTLYHHGEQNLYDTIIKLAQTFIGSNNLPILYADGQFGTRSSANDEASARYIYTNLNTFTNSIFLEKDNLLLQHEYEEGFEIEYKYFIPIIPMILINGVVGIGTGFSTNIPSYNPLDIITIIKKWLVSETEEDATIALNLSDILTPFYNGFTGSIVKDGNSRFICTGLYKQSKNIYTVTELPVGLWSDDFKEWLEDCIELKLINSFNNYCTPSLVHFEINSTHLKFERNLISKITTTISTSNMTMFNFEGKIQKYNSIKDILYEFCVFRLKYFQIRKDREIELLRKEILILGNKLRFISEIIESKINVMKIPNIEKMLEKENYDRIENSFNYLIKLPIDSLTEKKYNLLNNKINEKKKDLNIILEKEIGDMWIDDLNTLEEKIINYFST